MQKYTELTSEVLKLLDTAIESNYRVIVAIVGPPGSGKSTLAESIQKKINEAYNNYVTDNNVKIELHSLKEPIDLVGEVRDQNSELQTEMNSGLFSHVEDTEFKPFKAKQEDGSTIIVSRGGLPNQIRIKESRCQLESLKEIPKIAQIVPMDGFHLSRKHLDHFKDAVVAHRRRGSPSTFDSNNYLELCRILCKTCKIKPLPLHGKNESVFQKVSES